MSTGRSFTEYVSNRFYDDLFAAASRFIDENFELLDLHSYTVKSIDTASLSDISVKNVGVDDRDGMRIAFDVVLEAEIEVSETTRHFDNSDLCTQWFIVGCTGDLEQSLDDFEITSVNTYSQKNKHNKPLSDSLVPYLYTDKLEESANFFLKKYYPEALKTPMPIDTALLAERMGLSIEQHQITNDFSVFGQIFFADCDTKIYNPDSDTIVDKHITGRTIVVDPTAYFLRNLGSVNNTIVHECIHWDRHRKAFELERLYNKVASQIKCQVVGGIKEEKIRTATDWMEWQANALAPRVQMPLASFKTKASELIKQYQRELGIFELVDIMEPVIDALATFFVVSRCAAKIRMIDAGYEEAVGAFTYIDGHYVQPHAFKKGVIDKNQTFSISASDAIVESLWNSDLREKAQIGCYVYVDSHLCLNDPKYVTTDTGSAKLTEYARLHIDECCLAFDLKINSANKYGEQFYKECVLYRDANSGFTFEAHFAPEKSSNVQTKADEIAKYNQDIMSVMATLPRTFPDSLKALMKWSNITVEDLAEKSLLSSKTIQRMRNELDYNTSIG